MTFVSLRRTQQAQIDLDLLLTRLVIRDTYSNFIIIKENLHIYNIIKGCLVNILA